MLKGRPTIDGRPGESLEPLDFDALKKKLQDEYGKIYVLTLLLVIFQSHLTEGQEIQNNISSFGVEL